MSKTSYEIVLHANYIPEIIYKKFTPHGKHKFKKSFISKEDAKNYASNAMDDFVKENGPIITMDDWNKASIFFRQNYS